MPTPTVPIALVLLAVVLLADVQPCAWAQAVNASHPAYDVVTIKPSDRQPGNWGIDVNGDTFKAGNVGLQDLLADAYDMRRDLISGIPGPLQSARFDIQARIVDADPEALKKLTHEERQALLLPVLADRFHLRTHVEQKILPIFYLVALPGGPKVALSASQNTGVSIYNSKLVATRTSMVQFAQVLSAQLHRTVVDRTGLAGLYDFKLESSPADSPEGDSSALPCIFTAVQEQLGLKLQPAKGPVSTLIVDHAEMPTEN